MNKIKKITKFKKSKKTNNKRNHKRRRMTRKLRGGGIKEFEGKKDNLVIPYDEPKPPANDETKNVSSGIDPLQEIQRLDRINENPQRKELVTREDYDILRDTIDELIDDVDGLLKIKDNETMVPLYVSNQTMQFVNKNITELNQSGFPFLYEPSFYPVIDLYQLLKFKRLKKIYFDIFTLSRILLPGVNDDGMPNIIGVPRIASGEEARSRNRKIISLFEDLEKVSYSKIKYIYLSPNSILRMGPIEYDLEGLKRILNQDGLLD